MAEYMEKRWECDRCNRTVKRGTMPPPGWHESAGRVYGNLAHCCPDAECVYWMIRFCDDNGFDLPCGIKAIVKAAEDVRAAREGGQGVP